MERKDFLEAIQNIGACEDDAQRRSLLSNLQNEVNADYDRIDSLTAENKTLSDANKSLQEYNMNLFKQIGAARTKEEEIKDETGHEGDPTPKPKRYEDLFDEKGVLK